MTNEAERPKCSCGKWPHEDFCWMRTVSARASESSPPQPPFSEEAMRLKCAAAAMYDKDPSQMQADIEDTTPRAIYQNGWLAGIEAVYQLAASGAAATAPSAPPKLITDSRIPHKAMDCGSRYCAQHRDVWYHYENEIAAPSPTATDWMRQYPIQLNAEQEKCVKIWAADERCWTTQETVEFNLRTFARKILSEAGEHAGAESKKEPE